MARRKHRPQLNLRIAFETTRISAQCLIDAYERLVPSKRRPVPMAGSTALAKAARPMSGRGGKHA